MNAQEAQNIKWSENIIIVDGDYIDHVAFDLIVNFERMLNRRIPAADFSQWVVNIALDGRLKPGNHETQVVLLHDKQNPKLENFGEFIINAIATGDEVAKKDDVLLDLLKTILNHEEVKRIMVVSNAENSQLMSTLRSTLRDVDDELKHITLFAMQPLEGGNFKQQILGYSLLNAMGISASEIESKIK